MKKEKEIYTIANADNTAHVFDCDEETFILLENKGIIINRLYLKNKDLKTKGNFSDYYLSK